MLYVSTRGGVEPVSFEDVILHGQAADGGLYVPESIPSITRRLDAFRSLTFVELALEIVMLFVDDIEPTELERILQSSFAAFDSDEVTPLVQIDKLHILELFHGPTLAFKDIALQVLGRLFEHVLQKRDRKMNILAATSGDTGSAAIAGVRGRKNIGIFVMFPNGRTSPLQELQMTTVLDKNVHCLGLDGSFDDCQHILKQLFEDQSFKRRGHLGAVNSINWARLLVQIVYYVYASLKFDEPVSFSVPTGNFGNILAGYFAMRMGAPIQRLILGTNENDILARFFASGQYQRGDVHHTISPSMDIQVASNLERFLYLHMIEDASRLVGFMDEFKTRGVAQLGVDGPVDGSIVGARVDMPETISTIGSIWQKSGYLVDPHTAVGIAAARRVDFEEPIVCLATAHPAKFPDAIAQATSGHRAEHPCLTRLLDSESRKTVLPAVAEQVKQYLKTHI